MDRIKIDKQNKKRIQKHIINATNLYGYEKDIELLEKNDELTEVLAERIFIDLMKEAQRTRDILKPKENDEFKQEIEEKFAQFDKIPKPERYEEFGYYDNAYRDKELNEIYSYMQVAFKLIELDNKYYECINLRRIANTAVNSINKIDRYKINLQPEEKEELQKIQEELKNLLNTNKTDMNKFQSTIEKFNKYAINIWNMYLTDVKDEPKEEYRWIVHNLTKGELGGDFRTKYMSTSLITNNIMGLFGFSNYGLIIKPKNIISANSKDTYTNNYRQDEDTLFNIKPPIKLPQEIEEECIQETIEKNGEMLNYEKESIYPEIVVDEYEIEGVYYISYGEKELSRNYESAKKIADEKGVALIERDISIYREKLGLEQMTDNMKKNLCNNILSKCCRNDKNLYKKYINYGNGFVKRNYKTFYQKYMQLKQKEGYSKDDILKAFAELTRNDIYFKEVSQKIDEMYLTPEEIQKLQLEGEYSLEGIKDKEKIKQKLEKVISEGIFYSADSQNQEKSEMFESIKRVIPQFDELKDVYIQLKLAGIENKLFEDIDFSDISYDGLLKKASEILEEYTKTTVEKNNKGKQQKNINDSNIKINECGEIIRKNNRKKEVRDQNLWRKRFKGWYNKKRNVRFSKMEAEILKSISEEIKGSTNNKKRSINLKGR